MICLTPLYPISNFQVDHGSTHSETRHAGDFGNIAVDSDGNGKIDLTIPVKSGSTLFGAEDQESILGRTLVIHELEDDLGTLSGSTSGTHECLETQKVSEPEFENRGFSGIRSFWPDPDMSQTRSVLQIFGFGLVSGVFQLFVDK